MGECFMTRRSGSSYQLPKLDAAFPLNLTTRATLNGTYVAEVKIVEDGKPADYTYQWYKNGSPISGATSKIYTIATNAIANYSLYCTVSNKAGSVSSRVALIDIQDAKPSFSYTGAKTLIEDKDASWTYKLTSSGTLTFNEDVIVDIWGVGGGGSGAAANGASGAGGGYSDYKTQVALTAGTPYTVAIGAGGAAVSRWNLNGNNGGASTITNGSTTIFSAAGGKKGIADGDDTGAIGGAGGSGGGAGTYTKYESAGAGGSNGANGGSSTGTGNAAGGTGSGQNMRPFRNQNISNLNSSAIFYYGAGGGGSARKIGSAAKGGSTGGGNGEYGIDTDVAATNGTNNTGGGGGGANNGTSGRGGSGIIMIRNAR